MEIAILTLIVIWTVFLIAIPFAINGTNKRLNELIRIGGGNPLRLFW